MTKLNLQLENQYSEALEHLPTVDSKELALMIAEAADDRKADNIVLLNVEKLSYVADYFVIVTGFSQPQLRAISTSIEDKIEEKFQRLPVRVEGKTDGNWILHDYGDVIAHIFLPEAREFYNLEAFWGGAEKIIYNSEYQSQNQN
ncbi:ribosome silencing factor [Cyanobacterium aponinum AL20118]|uniref:Ribosomal silencing factor RsfS n=2 Tax=Cyanobacterium aponinum TaxID=379064 RepID=K9Z2B7_CYAAP|nr:ribosome silencing factor [Cyanobacterium aponinum]AFZ52877.1 iojap-like protein [Cyanobacterium aponinum PCC 10605]PHV64429.1 ribosome silencing factor [Cyanobacterium aponinum IPPAS B-1201]WPF86974.1 ribosome silencing factor [Cyanobacterium aponinum AL20115]